MRVCWSRKKVVALGLSLGVFLLQGCQLLRPSEQNIENTLFFFGPVILVGVYAWFLYRRYNHSQRNLGEPWWKAYRKPLLIVGFIFITVLGINLLPERTLTEPQKKLQFGQKVDNSKIRLEAYRELVAMYPDSLEMHFHYLVERGVHHGFFTPEADVLEELYASRMYSSDPHQRAIGLLGSAFILIEQQDSIRASTLLNKSELRNQPFLHYLKGKKALVERDTGKAILLFLSEYKHGGYRKGAMDELYEIFLDRYDASSLLALSYLDPQVTYWHPEDFQSIRFQAGDVSGYYRAVVRRLQLNLNTFGLIASFAVFMLWGWYVWRMDLFEPKKPLYFVPIMLLGIGASFLSFPLGQWSFEWYLPDHWQEYPQDVPLINWIAFYVLGVGIVEELVKLLPLILVVGVQMKRSKKKLEPYDFVLMASMSALAFSFTENLFKYQMDRLDIVMTRATLSVVGHMCWSSMVAYGWVLTRFRYRGKFQLLGILGGWLLAGLLHGLFDALLHLELFYVALFILLFSIQLWWTAQNNSLNNASVFDRKAFLSITEDRFRLVMGLIGVLLLQSFLIGWNFGPAQANAALVQSLWISGIMIMFLGSSLGRFEVFQGYWQPINFPYRPEHILLPREINPHNYVGVEMEIWVEKEGSMLGPFLPRKGRVFARRSLGRDTSWYLVKTRVPMGISNYEDSYFLIRFKDYQVNLKKDLAYEIELRLLKNRELIEEVKGKEMDVSKAITCLFVLK